MPDRRPAIVTLPVRTAARLARLVGQPPVATAAGRAKDMVGAAVRAWDRRPGARARHLRRLSSVPLANLYTCYPEARRATPREIGLRSVDLDMIAGSAVGGPTQRGSDFLPLRAFRSQNWAGRWQRIRRAIDGLAILPPIDVVRYADRYWVLDGHNRVAAALYVGQVEIDANVTELVPPGANPSERPGNLAAALAGMRSLRAAGQGGRLESVADDIVLGVPGRGGRPDERWSRSEGQDGDPTGSRDPTIIEPDQPDQPDQPGPADPGAPLDDPTPPRSTPAT